MHRGFLEASWKTDKMGLMLQVRFNSVAIFFAVATQSGKAGLWWTCKKLHAMADLVNASSLVDDLLEAAEVLLVLLKLL